MKKILIVLMMIFYIFTSFITIKLFSLNQDNNIISKGKFEVIVSSWNKDISEKDEANKILNLAKKYNINIYKAQYDYKNGRKIENIYAAIGNNDTYIKEYSNQKEVHLFDGSIINFWNIVDTNNIPIDGSYYIDYSNKYSEQYIKSKMNSIGLNINNVKINQYNNINNIKYLNKNILFILFILDIIISLTVTYFIISRFKEFAVKKLFGYSNKNLLLEYSIQILKIYFVACILTFIFQLIYLYFYNRLKYFTQYICYWLIGIVLISVILFVSNLANFFIIKKINIVKMIKNKKPYGTIEWINLYSKFIFSIILISLFTNCFNCYISLKNKSYNSYWNKSKQYCYLEYGNTYNTYGNLEKYYNQCNINEKLFNYVNNNNGILIAPSIGIQKKEMGIKKENLGGEYNINNGNCVFVNANYVNENNIYGVNNQKINMENYNEGNVLKVLIPEQYEKYNDIIQKGFQTWFKSRKKILNMFNEKYGDINKSNDSKNNDLKVEMIYIKNNQNVFLYQANYENKVALSPIMIVVNNSNIGKDYKLSFLMSGFMMPSIKNGYDYLNEELKKLGLSKYIINKPSVYNRNSLYINNLKNNLEVNINIIIIIIIVLIILIIFSVANEIDKKRRENVIKYLHGYSLKRIYYFYFIKLSIFYFLLEIICIIKNSHNHHEVFLFIVLMYLLEIIVTTILLKITFLKNLKNTLKGE